MNFYRKSDPITLREISIREEGDRYIAEETGVCTTYTILSDGPVSKPGAHRVVYLARRSQGVGGRLRLRQCISTTDREEQMFLRTALLQERLLEMKETVNPTAILFGVHRGEDGHLWEIHDFKDSVTYDAMQEKVLHTALLHFKALAEAVRAYHKLGYLLLDLKPANFSVLHEGAGLSGVNLFDFDTAVTKEELLRREIPIASSWAYGAPEVLRGEAERIGVQADLYSLGVILFEKLFGRLPSHIRESRSFSHYDFSRCADKGIFAGMSVKTKAALEELFRHAVCTSVEERFCDVDALLCAVDNLLHLTDPKAHRPHLVMQDICPTCICLGYNHTYLRAAFLRAERCVVVTGVGGVGKSEAARRYAQEFRSKYDGVQFLVWDRKWAEAKDLLDCLNVSGGEDPGELDQGSLLILDNCPDTPGAAKLLKSVLEQTGSAHVLITTRGHGLDVLPGVRHVDLAEDAHLSFSVFCTQYAKPLTDVEAETARRILAAVGHNTYAADMMGRELRMSGMRVETFEEKMHKKGILAAAPLGAQAATGKDGDYQAQNFETKVKFLFADVLSHEFSHAECQVLRLLCRHSATYYHEDLVCRVVGDNGEQILARQAVENLVGRNWLRRSGGAIGVHPLVAEVLPNVLGGTPEDWWTMAANLLSLPGLSGRDMIGMRFLLHDTLQDLPGKEAACHRIRTTLERALANLPLRAELGSLFGVQKNGFEVSAAAHDGRSARYFYYEELSNRAIQYLYVRHRNYALCWDALDFAIQEARPHGQEEITILNVTATSLGQGEHIFDLMAMSEGRSDSLHEPPLERYPKDADSTFLRALYTTALHTEGAWNPSLSSRRFSGGFPAAPVTRIARGAFSFCPGVTGVALPGTLHTIGEQAFQGTRLQAVDLPASLRVVEDRAFEGCKELTRVHFAEGTEQIGWEAFYNCQSLSEVHLPDTLRVLGPSVFRGAPIRTVYLGKNLQTMGRCCFAGTALEEVRIPDSLAELPARAFLNCTKLRRVHLGTTLRSIGEECFMMSRALRAVHCGMELRQIGYMAFDSCTALEKITLPGHVQVDRVAFHNCPGLHRAVFFGWPYVNVAGELPPSCDIVIFLPDGQCFRFRRNPNPTSHDVFILDPEICPEEDDDTVQ